MTDPTAELKAHAERLRRPAPDVELEGMIRAALSHIPTAMGRRLVGMMATAAMILGGNVALAAAAAPSVPGDPLHHVDRAFEWVADRVGLGGSRWDQRLSEAERVAQSGEVTTAMALINEALEHVEPGLHLARVGNNEGSQVSAIARLLRTGASAPHEVSELARRVGATISHTQAIDDLDIGPQSTADRGHGAPLVDSGVDDDPGLVASETDDPDRGQGQSSTQSQGQGKNQGQGEGQNQGQGQGQGRGQGNESSEADS